MSRIRSRDTKPELAVRSMLHRLGYRFTVNGPKSRSLPRRPRLPDRRLRKPSRQTIHPPRLLGRHPGRTRQRPLSIWECGEVEGVKSYPRIRSWEADGGRR